MYETEKRALAWAIEGAFDYAEQCLHALSRTDLDELIDGLDKLAQLADDEAMRREGERA